MLENSRCSNNKFFILKVVLEYVKTSNDVSLIRIHLLVFFSFEELANNIRSLKDNTTLSTISKDILNIFLI